MAALFIAEPLERRRYLAVSINGGDTGRIFDGLGALSNSSSRLLYDYPEPARTQILDYMFKPNYGASLQILKVEIGGDTNSTDISEPSHMRSRSDLDFSRGFEWWLMKEAKARNPNIKLFALEWGAPGWFTGGFYSQDNINYITSFLDGAAQQGLNFDYVGGWNESVANPSTSAIRSWFINLKAALVATHPSTKLVAYDDGGTNWRIGDDMASYPDFAAAIDILGQHSPGVWRSLYQNYTVTANALNTGKPLWASEQSAESHDVGGASWARGIVRAYQQAKITASLAWCGIDSFYPSMNHADTGIILADKPWSGWYDLGSMVWVFAHTAQFTQPGWQYLDNACGTFGNGATFVTLKSNTSSDYSTVIEAMDATAPENETFAVSGGLSTGTVHVWASNIASATLADDFLHVQDITPVGGTFSVTVQPGYVYTLSTTTGQSKGSASYPASGTTQMPLPYSEDFENYGGSGKLARYWADVQGGFETAPATGGRTGTVYRQVVTTKPQSWTNGATEPPTSMMGDMRWWGDYQFSSDVLLEQSGYVELIGRIGGAPSPHVSGYHFKINSSGAWSLYSEEISGTDTTLASGTTSFSLNTWHNMSLKMTGSQLSVILDGNTLSTITNSGFITGNVAIRVSNLGGVYQNAQFDNISIIKTAEPPVFLPHAQMSATASDTYSATGGFYQGDYYLVSYGIDDRPESIWHSAFNPRVAPPHYYTVDLGSMQTIEGLTYQPRIDGNNNGMINTYSVLLSPDGVNWNTVIADATWPTSSATKTATWPALQERYVQLYESAGVNGLMSIGELNVIQTRSATVATPDLVAASDLGISSTDNLTSLDNSSSTKKLSFTISGTSAGATVRIYGDGALIGNAAATGSSTTVTTNGTMALTDGAHLITATQQNPTKAESLISTGLTVTIDATAPGASLGAAVPTTGSTTLNIPVTYTDANGVDASSFDLSDVTVTGPSGNLSILSILVPDPTNGSPRTVNYRVSAPGGFWDDADNGVYTVAQVANQVKDLAGVARPAGAIGTLDISTLGFTWMNGSVLNVAFNRTATPITLDHSSGDVTVSRSSTTLSFSGVSSVIVIGTSNSDALNFNGPIAPPITFNGDAGADTLNVNSGTYTFDADAGTSTAALNVTVNSGATAIFNATQHLAALTLGGDAKIAANGNRTMVVKALSITGAGSLDIADNELIVDYTGATPVSAIRNYILGGRGAAGAGNATWMGPGINSSKAALDPDFLAVGYADNSSLPFGQYTVFAGETVDSTAVLVKYTKAADANLDGVVDDTDVTIVGVFYNTTDRSWATGDFDYQLGCDDNDVTLLGLLYSPGAVPV